MKIKGETRRFCDALPLQTADTRCRKFTSKNSHDHIFDHLRNIFRVFLCKKFNTENGYGDMVVMSMTAYEERLARIDMYAKIMEGKAQADNGELLDRPSTSAGLKAKCVKQIM